MTERRENGAARDETREAVELRRARFREHLDKRLDEALEETFPASDSIAVTPPRRGAS